MSSIGDSHLFKFESPGGPEILFWDFQNCLKLFVGIQKHVCNRMDRLCVCVAMSPAKPGIAILA